MHVASANMLVFRLGLLLLLHRTPRVQSVVDKDVKLVNVVQVELVCLVLPC